MPPEMSARERIENLWNRATPVGPLLDAYRAEVLREAAQMYAGQADELDRAARAALDPDMDRAARRMRGFAASLRRLAGGAES